MDIEIRVDGSCTSPKVIILTDKITDEVNEIVRKLSEQSDKMLAGFAGDELRLIDRQEITRIYASDGKVIVEAGGEKLTVRQRLYELEEMLGRDKMVRISNSEIINLKKVKSFDLSLTGTVCVRLKDGTVTYVSRRYVSKIKQVLGI